MDYMALALDLAERAKGTCNPNPAVGAVLVRDGKIIGRGYTQPRGQSHAEIMALDGAGSAARGATLYVTLEPCSHQGLTGPCSERVIAAGIREVHCASLDPSPWVNGGGRAALEQAGLRVQVGEGERQARWLNRDYLHWVETGRPYLTAKYAMTLDGKIATRTGSSRWVTGPEARTLVGRWRTTSDAVMVGIGTVLIDDPALTARAADGSPLARQPLRVVLDSRGRMPAEARVVRGELPGGTLIATTPAGLERLQGLERSGVELWVGEPGPDGRVDPAALLDELGRRRLISVLVEAGGTLLATLLERELIDEVAAFIAPKLVGGEAAPTPIGGAGRAEMSAATELDELAIERLGSDILVRGRPRRCSPGS